MAAGAGHFEGALGGLLAADIFEVDRIVLGFGQQCIAVHLQGQDAISSMMLASMPYTAALKVL